MKHVYQSVTLIIDLKSPLGSQAAPFTVKYSKFYSSQELFVDFFASCPSQQFMSSKANGRPLVKNA